MDGCLSHSDLVDDRGQVTVMKYPPNCPSVHQPMDQRIVAATELNYRKELHDVKVSTMRVAETLRAQAKERKMVVGTMGLAEGTTPICWPRPISPSLYGTTSRRRPPLGTCT